VAGEVLRIEVQSGGDTRDCRPMPKPGESLYLQGTGMEGQYAEALPGGKIRQSRTPRRRSTRQKLMQPRQSIQYVRTRITQDK